MDIRDKNSPEYKCDDGHFVRSKAEMLIDNWLYIHDIVHAYEIRLPLADHLTTLYCDFYLPKHNVYIEFFGGDWDDIDYRKRCNKKIKQYHDNDLTCIEIFPDDIKRLSDYLSRYLS